MYLPYPIETINQIQFAHCSGANWERANKCLHHTAHKMLAKNMRESYAVANPAVITGAQPCPLFAPDHKERYVWGISRIYDNVRAANLHGAKWKVMSCFGADVYYKVKQLCRAINETSTSLLPKRATMPLPSNSTAMKNSNPALMRLADTSRLRSLILDIWPTVP